MIQPDTIKHINAHMAKAERRHPKFCNELLATHLVQIYAECVALERSFADLNPCAENILNEEISEIYEQIAECNWLHARSEIFDAIAVLLRLDAEIVKRIEGGAE